jgi:hypothetical protein
MVAPTVVVDAEPFVDALKDHDAAWLLIAMASTLAGNFNVPGSIANLIVVQRAVGSGVGLFVQLVMLAQLCGDRVGYDLAAVNLCRAGVHRSCRVSSLGIGMNCHPEIAGAEVSLLTRAQPFALFGRHSHQLARVRPEAPVHRLHTREAIIPGRVGKRTQRDFERRFEPFRGRGRDRLGSERRQRVADQFDRLADDVGKPGGEARMFERLDGTAQGLAVLDGDL